MLVVDRWVCGEGTLQETAFPATIMTHDGDGVLPKINWLGLSRHWLGFNWMPIQPLLEPAQV